MTNNADLFKTDSGLIPTCVYEFERVQGLLSVFELKNIWGAPLVDFVHERKRNGKGTVKGGRYLSFRRSDDSGRYGWKEHARNYDFILSESDGAMITGVKVGTGETMRGFGDFRGGAVLVYFDNHFLKFIFFERQKVNAPFLYSLWCSGLVKDSVCYIG